MSKNKTVRNVFFAIFCLFACISLGYAESCSTAGAVEYKYTANACSYDTSVRTCCATTGAWSGWGEECPKTCDPSAKPAETEPCGEDGSGTRSRSVTCDTVSLTWKTGSWGICSYCTPGEVNEDLINNRCFMDNFRKVAVCNSSGTAWNCECNSKYESLCNAPKIWFPDTCMCCGPGQGVILSPGGNLQCG